MIDKLATLLGQYSAKLKFSIWLTMISLIVVIGFSLWQGGARVQSDILAMLPNIQEDPLTDIALSRVEEQLSNSIYLGFVADNQTQAIQAAQQVITELNEHGQGIFVDIKSADINQAESLNNYYFPHRFNLLTPAQAQTLENGKLDSLIGQAQQQLYNAFSYATSGLLAKDPLLLYPQNLQALAPKQALEVHQGILIATLPVDDSKGKVAAIVMAKGVGSAFSPKIQEQQISVLTQAFEQVRLQDTDIEILRAGALFHAAAATQLAKSEVTSLGLASLIGVCLLVWLAFRSLMPLTIALLTISTSMLVAVVMTTWVFSELHLLTLVFGTSLIGIAIDYSFHFYCERLNKPDVSAAQVIQHIFPAITLALITSVLAYSSIGFAPFPGMQQVAVFCASGLISAYITLVLAYPLLASGTLPKGEKQLKLAEIYLHRVDTLLVKLPPKGLSLIVIICLSLSSFGILRLTSDDDIRNLQQSPPEVQVQENALRSLLSGGTDNQFLLVRANSEQALLQRLEDLAPRLNNAVKQQLIGNSFSLSNYLPSQDRQERNYRLQAEIYQQKLSHIIDSLGMDEELAPELKQAYLTAEGQYIDASTFLNSQAGKLFAPLWIAPGDDQKQFGAIVLLGGISDIDKLRHYIADLSDVQLVDKVGDISKVMGKYRQLTLILLAVAMLAATLIFSSRFSMKLASLVVAVPALSAIFTLATLGLMGTSLTLFHALALILVFGIGVDYSVFFAESKQQSRGVMMAVFMSASSTILAFGLLAFSSTPAIHFFGLTLLIGIGFTFMLSPFIQTFTRTSK
ncbi:putative exporter [Shewanella psychrophila]|uniref:Putative exporter n=1 Tax=Shewanella psychrophila TaxID=225848 RepID=A0A1S6HSI4_9GAMM|nr:MMPL family transporter [Shewanella psychrophila]AQS38475.1 putative exporter [Shewanella psychrophila]